MANEATAAAGAFQVAEALNVLVLHTLDSAGPLDGYRIATRLERLVGPAEAPLDLRTLYASILQQTQRGLLSASVTSCEGRKVRTYTITPRGRRYLKGARLAWDRSASLLSSLVEEQDRQRRELELAREVQTHFFSSLAPVPDLGLDIAGRYRPAREVGGDYYDIIRLSDTSVALTLGDVSGKGIAAALLMATLRAFVRSQPSRPEDLATIMARLNQLLHQSCTGARYASLFYAVYDTTRADLVYVNAGHPPPVVLDAAAEGTTAERLDAGGPVLGLLPEATYEIGRAPFNIGDVLVAYSDGLTEACNATGADWGETRLMSATCDARTRSADGLADHLVSAVARFAGQGPQQDDMTVLIARRRGGGSRA